MKCDQCRTAGEPDDVAWITVALRSDGKYRHPDPFKRDFCSWKCVVNYALGRIHEQGWYDAIADAAGAQT